MAINSNQEVIQFSNEYLRVNSDSLAQVYYSSKNLVNQWNAQSMSAKITNSSDEDIGDAAYGTDGTDGDGRPPVTGEDAYAQYTRAVEFVTDMEANNNAKLNTILAYAVNPIRS